MFLFKIDKRNVAVLWSTLKTPMNYLHFRQSVWESLAFKNFATSWYEHSLGKKDKLHFLFVSEPLTGRILGKPNLMRQTGWVKGISYCWTEWWQWFYQSWCWVKTLELGKNVLLLICFNSFCGTYSLGLKEFNRDAFQLFISPGLKLLSLEGLLLYSFILRVISSFPLNTSAFNLGRTGKD